jgi:eukaryotic-like serine/threonine-protein kinase
MSPEQVLEKQLNHQTDIYSLGVVLYQLITGKLPFQGSNRGSLLYQILNIEAVAPSVHRWGVPPELDRIVLRALEKPLGDRYQQWSELSRDLAHVFKHLTLPEESVSDARYPSSRTSATSRSGKPCGSAAGTGSLATRPSCAKARTATASSC